MRGGEKAGRQETMPPRHRRVERESVQMQVDLVDAVVLAAQRPVNGVSFTVPQARNDAG